MLAAIELPEISMAWAVVILALGYSLLAGWKSVRTGETDAQRENEIDRHAIATAARDIDTLDALRQTIDAQGQAIQRQAETITTQAAVIDELTRPRQ